MSFKGRVMRQPIDKDGYCCVAISVDGKLRRPYVHRLVLEAFVGPCPDGLLTRHLDGDPSNNVLTNLEYGTPRQNMVDMVEHGRAGTGGPVSPGYCVRSHRLIGRNRWMVRKWGRNGRAMRDRCRACNRARLRLQHLPASVRRDQILAVSDEIYQELTGLKMER